MSIDEIIQNPEANGLKVRVKKVIHVQKAEPEDSGMPPTPPLIKNRSYRSSQSRPINSRQVDNQDEFYEESPKSNNVRSQKPSDHNPSDENCDCHSCNPRKFCLCDYCQNSGHSLNCTCAECRPDIYKKKIQSIFKSPTKPKPIEETPRTYNRYNNNAPASISGNYGLIFVFSFVSKIIINSEVSGPFMKQYNGSGFNKHLKVIS